MEFQQVTGNEYEQARILLNYDAEGKKMIEGYIIDKLKREKDELERQQWEPIPLPLEEYDPQDRKEKTKKPEKEREFVVEFVFAGVINGSPARV